MKVDLKVVDLKMVCMKLMNLDVANQNGDLTQAQNLLIWQLAIVAMQQELTLFLSHKRNEWR